jgi:hypothetical protein
MKTFIDFVYTLLIGASVALFVGLGIWTFYSGPKMPEYPDYPIYSSTAPTEAQDKAYQERQSKYDKEFKQYEKDNKSYGKKVAGIALAGSAVFYVAGMWLMRRGALVGEGLALGGIFTGAYAATRAALSDFKQLVFASVTLLLVMLILLAAYRVRIHSSTPTTRKS